MDIVRLENIANKLIIVQGEKVLLDSDVGEIYDVETKRINEAVKNNPDKFSVDHILELSDESWGSLKSKNSTLNGIGREEHRKYKPKAFTERDLYILVTILKGELAVHTTLAIVDTFYKIRHLSRNTNEQQALKMRQNRKPSCKRVVRSSLKYL